VDQHDARAARREYVFNHLVEARSAERQTGKGDPCSAFLHTDGLIHQNLEAQAPEVRDKSSDHDVACIEIMVAEDGELASCLLPAPRSLDKEGDHVIYLLQMGRALEKVAGIHDYVRLRFPHYLGRTRRVDRFPHPGPDVEIGDVSDQKPI
jgi:hypothetical protein